MPQTPHQRKASDRVAAWLAHHEKGRAWLIDQTGLDPGTVGDFLNAARWPKVSSQGKIEKALGWPAGSICQIGHGADPGAVGAPRDHRAALLVAQPRCHSREVVWCSNRRPSAETGEDGTGPLWSPPAGSSPRVARHAECDICLKLFHGNVTLDVVETPGYVASPGLLLEESITNAELYRLMLAMRAGSDRIEAAVADLSRRVADLEQPRP